MTVLLEANIEPTCPILSPASGERVGYLNHRTSLPPGVKQKRSPKHGQAQFKIGDAPSQNRIQYNNSGSD